MSMHSDTPPATSSGSLPSSASALPLCKLRVQILSARGLPAKDRNGKSDPFVTINIPGAPISAHSSDPANPARKQTTVKAKTLDPVWKENEAQFEFDLLPDWFGPHFSTLAAASLDPEEVRSAVAEAQVHSSLINALGTSPGKASGRPKLTFRSSSRRSITGAAGAATKILVAPVKLGAAGAKAVGRGVPRPMRLRRNNRLARTGGDHAATTDALIAAANSLASVSRGSIQLDATNAIVTSLEFVVWDKDRFSANDYMGECTLPVSEWCQPGHAEWTKAKAVWIPLVSSRPDSKASGELQVKVGLVPISRPVSQARANNTSEPNGSDNTASLAAPAAPKSPYTWSVDEVYEHLVLATLESQGSAVRAIPASQSVGTGEAFVDDGLSSDSELEGEGEDDSEAGSESEDDAEEDEEEEDDTEASSDDSENEAIYDEHYLSVAGVPSTASGATPETDTPASVAAAAAAPDAKQPGRYKRIFLRRKSQSNTTSGATTPNTGGGSDQLLPVSGESISYDGSSSGGSIGRRRLRGVPGVGKKKIKKIGGKKGNTPDDTTGAKPSSQRRKRAIGRKQRKEFAFKAETGMDIIGLVMLEVKRATDLPRWRNMTNTSFDMDPFTIVSFGQKIFRTRVMRHTLNPVWNEKLIFHVRRHETNFQTKFMIYDWDKISSNDFVGGASIDVAALIEAAPKPDPNSGLYDPNAASAQSMHEFVLSLSAPDKIDESKSKTGKQAAQLVIEAKFTPYEALRQRFWRQLALQYDTNDSGTLSHLELITMLDSLGSTLSVQTIEDFFRQHGKNPEEDEITIDEAIIAIESEIKKPSAEKRRAASVGLSSGATTPSLSGLGPVGAIGSELNQDMDVSGPGALEQGSLALINGALASNEPSTKPIATKVRGPGDLERDLSHLSMVSTSSSSTSRSASGTPISSSTDAKVQNSTPSQSEKTQRRTASATGSSSSSCPTPPALTVDGQPISSGTAVDAQSVERVIRLQSCPLCHMPRLSKKAEVDIVTHLAVCASQDWRRVDSMMVSNFVTASQAHRKWYTKVVHKISQGDYSLGANSANIIVQDRLSGELLEEKMQVYVRLGIRLLYKGARSRMEGARVKRMLKNMSVKQGVKFDNPASAREIAPFIAFHNLNIDEVLDPIDSFKTFNEFFYRKLKPDARPNSEPENPKRLVSGADCRMMAFESVQEATRIWIKGREFSIGRLLGNGTPSTLERYQNGGSVAIFRLAPQDYHRFHCPADATVGKFTWIEGQYYTVNPMAIRSAIDVYGENIRVIVPFHSDEFGTFFAVCIGAMMVGSTVLTVKEGQRVKRGEEFGYFKFGGSTIVLVFEKDRVSFDEDILDNSRGAIETLVRVGMGVGRKTEGEAEQ